jgi:pimeloyl-ACP methyl ester carboxylesterase
LVELGGRGVNLLIAPANGFPLETYFPMLEPLTDSYRLIALPPRALWKGIGAPPEAAGSWTSLADDLLSGLRQHELGPVIGVGHSFGAVAMLLAAEREPERFRGLALLDPTIFPEPQMEKIAMDLDAGIEPRLNLIDVALRRKSRFASLDEGFNHWRSRPLFEDWSDEALRGYTSAALKQADDGDGLELAWPAPWEAWYYRSFYPATWDHLRRLPRDMPLLSIRGERSDTFGREAEAHLNALRPETTILCLKGAGHLFPQSAPERALALLRPWLDRLTTT